MSEKNITSQEIIAEVRKLAEEQPEYIYQDGQSGLCFYHANDEHAACIFGQAFARH